MIIKIDLFLKNTTPPPPLTTISFKKRTRIFFSLPYKANLSNANATGTLCG